MSILTRNKPAETDEPATLEVIDVPDERPFPGYVRANLLPNSIRERAKVTVAKRIAVLLVVLAALIVAGLYYLAQRDIANAQEQVDAAQLRNIQLQGQVAQYAEVPAVFAAASKGEEALGEAMSAEVRWAFLLNQLSFATPAGVSLTTVQGTIAEDGPTQTSPGDVLPPIESVGTMTFAGTGSSFSEVAAWLDSLQTLQDYAYPFLTNSTKSDNSSGAGAAPQSGGPISWESTADLSSNALSGRYGTPPPAEPSAGSGGASPDTSAPSDGAGEGAS